MISCFPHDEPALQGLAEAVSLVEHGRDAHVRRRLAQLIAAEPAIKEPWPLAGPRAQDLRSGSRRGGAGAVQAGSQHHGEYGAQLAAVAASNVTPRGR